MHTRSLSFADYSAITWADYCAGQVLDKLDALGIDDNTIVIAHADVRIKRGYPHPLQWAT